MIQLSLLPSLILQDFILFYLLSKVDGKSDWLNLCFGMSISNFPLSIDQYYWWFFEGGLCCWCVESGNQDCECQSWLQCLPQQTHVVMTSVFYKGMTHKSHHMFLTMTLQHGDKLAITTDMWNSHQIQQPRRCRARLWWGKQTSPVSPSGFSQGGQHRTWFGISPPTCNHTQPWAYATWRVEM